MEGRKIGTLELDDTVFGVEVNGCLMHLMVVVQLANKHQETQKARTYFKISNGGRKPWRQKGTGHAGQGSTRSPQWKDSGIVFTPTPRDHTIRLNKKEERAAFRSVLTGHVRNNKFIVVDELKFDEIKIRKFQNVMDNLEVSKTLVVLADNNQNTVLSARDIVDVKTSQVGSIDVYDVLKYNIVVATKVTVASIEEVYT